jgi:cytochrome P450
MTSPACQEEMMSETALDARIPPHVPRDRVVDFDITESPSLDAEVHGAIRSARDRFPSVAYTPRNGGHWLVYGRDNLQRVLSETETFSSKQLSLQPVDSPMKMIPLQLDPPEHAPYRHLLLKHLGPKEIRGMEPFIRSWAEQMIAPLETATSCDFVKAVAEPMPVSVFMVTMGMPLERFDEFRGLAVAALDPHTPPEERMGLHGRIFAVIGELIQARAADPRDDLVSKLLAERLDGRPLNQEELFSICYLLFLAGLDTVTNAMAYGMRHVAGDPALQASLRADPSTIPAVVEDMLRRYTFVNTTRVAAHDTVLDGAEIKAGEALCCVLWAGSNDEGADSETAARQFAFGSGPHTCLGMHLARAELRIMYETWFAHIGDFERADEAVGAIRGGSVMAITSLPLRLHPRKTR